MKAKFKKFLKDNRAYRKFVRDIKNQRNMNFSKYCEKKISWYKIISGAFPWRCTKDFDYYMALNEKWLKLLEEDSDYWHTLSNKWLKLYDQTS